jgi:hypothetical protein
MRNDEKRALRQLKRDLKRAGNKRRRQHLKRELAENPEEAPFTKFDYGRTSSASLNGMDKDTTRRRRQAEEPNPADDSFRDGIDETDRSG